MQLCLVLHHIPREDFWQTRSLCYYRIVGGRMLRRWCTDKLALPILSSSGTGRGLSGCFRITPALDPLRALCVSIPLRGCAWTFYAALPNRGFADRQIDKTGF
jgi:hypothetical protein